MNLCLNKTKIILCKDTDCSSYNCYALVMLAIGAIRKPRWLEQEQIRNWLDTRADTISKATRKGDIATLEDDGYIVHAAIYLGSGKWFHKCGWAKCTVESLKRVKNSYGHSSVAFYRVKDKNNAPARP